MTATLAFETHSTSVDNEFGLASGWHPIGLSELGRRQARTLGERNAGKQVDVVYCSDLRRAVETAEVAFGELGVPIVRDARLRECHYGLFTHYPAAEIERLRVARIHAPFPVGESYRQVVERVRIFLDELHRRHTVGRIVLIGHRATYYALDHLLRGVPLETVVAAPFAWQPGWEYEWSAKSKT